MVLGTFDIDDPPVVLRRQRRVDLDEHARGVLVVAVALVDLVDAIREPFRGPDVALVLHLVFHEGHDLTGPFGAAFFEGERKRRQLAFLAVFLEAFPLGWGKAQGPPDRVLTVAFLRQLAGDFELMGREARQRRGVRGLLLGQLLVGHASNSFLIRYTVEAPTRVRRMILFTGTLARSMSAMRCSVPADTFGRPSVLPCLRARSRPSIVRSRISSRSKCAREPITLNMSCPAGVEVSSARLRTNSPTFRASSSATSPTRCGRLRPSRSSAVTPTMSNLPSAAAFIRASSPGRLSRPFAPLMPSSVNSATTV